MRMCAWLLLVSLLCLTTSCTNDTGYSTTESTPAADDNAPAASDADNTARNAESTAQADATAQSESEADIRISAAIRKSVVDDSSLSVNAHNVKITTADGTVTLRGPVKSEQEKTSIETKAKQVAGVTKVDNLLEVERNP